tara:strand:+ start:239 stop:667 length:429 start_codon:yes stop_codon:yes gene_type:complete
LITVVGRVLGAATLLLFYLMCTLFLFVYAQGLDRGAYHGGFFWWNLWFVIISTASLATLLLRGKVRTWSLMGVSAIWLVTTTYVVFLWLGDVFGWSRGPDVYQASLAEVLMHTALLAIPAAILLLALRQLKATVANGQNPST